MPLFEISVLGGRKIVTVLNQMPLFEISLLDVRYFTGSPVGLACAEAPG